ncbi:MAG: replicative DNA helicase [Eubacteriales bacterium]|nr:replicative DNA helicase [Eubacteriales bacterium]MDY3332305.1 replicative DNA helicase [Gallibacter sp.]
MEEQRIPQDVNAEGVVLGAMLRDDSQMPLVTPELLDMLSPDDFFLEAHREIFKAIDTLFRANKTIDSAFVAEELTKRKMLEAIGGRAYLQHLIINTPSVRVAIGYAKMMIDRSTRRKLVEVGEDIVERAYDISNEVSDIIEDTERRIFRTITDRGMKDTVILKELLPENIRIIGERENIKNSVTGVPSGLIDLDRKLSGFQKSDMIVVAARPAMGKTAFALNVALNAAKKGSKVLIFSLEMADTQLSQRILSIESHVPTQKMNGVEEMQAEDWASITMATSTLENCHIEINETPGIKISGIKSVARKMKMQRGLDMIILDYLQLMSGDTRENRQQQVSTLSREMKLLAREMDCPVIVLSQLSRAPENRDNHRPILADLRESGAIEQDADIVLFLYRDEVYHEDTEEPGVAEIIVAKHRNGPIGTVKARWLGVYTKFANFAK